jgi:CheY-like chemotaxis protein/signal transduction histidine kinase
MFFQFYGVSYKYSLNMPKKLLLRRAYIMTEKSPATQTLVLACFLLGLGLLLTGVLFLSGKLALLQVTAGAFLCGTSLVVLRQMGGLVREVKKIEEYRQVIKYHTSLLDNSADCMVVFDCQWQPVYANPKACGTFLNLKNTGNDLGNLLGLEAKEKETLMDLVLSGREWIGEGNLEIDGQDRFFRHKIKPLTTGKIIDQFVLVSTDITELIQCHRERTDAYNARTRFLSYLNHEMRTPMIGILGAVDLLEQSPLSAEQAENTQIIRECSEDLLLFTNQILDTSKLETGQVKLNPEPCSLFEIIMDVVSEMEPLIKMKNITFKKEIDYSTTETFLVDNNKLRQILVTLLTNKVRFNSTGLVSISSRACQESSGLWFFHCAIADTDVHLSKVQHESISYAFDPASLSSSGSLAGPNLGLHYCTKIVELMKGQIITSKNGQGTITSFRVPLGRYEGPAKPYDLQKPDIIPENIPLLSLSSIPVLVVDDNPLNQKIVSQMLRNYGFEVTTCSNGQECLKLVKSNNFAVILMDMQMPVMDGYQAARIISQDRNYRHIPIIAITAHSLTGDREKCLACGCVAYISKPFRAEELVSEINKHISFKSPARNTVQLFNQSVAELMPEFLVLLGEMIDDLCEAEKRKDLSAIQSISHDIKGTAGMYGFSKIYETASRLEEAAREKSYPSIRVLLSDIFSHYKQLNTHVS